MKSLVLDFKGIASVFSEATLLKNSKSSLPTGVSIESSIGVGYERAMFSLIKSDRVKAASFFRKKSRGASEETSDIIRLLRREEIAVGGTSLIYRLTYSNAGREVEKRLIPKYQGKPEYETLQKREFEILDQISHPLVVKPHRLKVERTGWGADTNLLTLEYIEGVPLSNFFDYLGGLSRQDRVSWAHEIFYQLGSVLHYLAERKIIHGDLAPENILVQKNGYIKLIDFGVARKERDEAQKFLIGGRPRFRSPEVSKSGRTSLRGDVYALGRIYEELLGDAAEESDFRLLIDSMLNDRKLPVVLMPKSGWFSGLSPLPESSFFKVHGVVRQKTRLIRNVSVFQRYSKLTTTVCVLLLTPFISSFLPQRAVISVNTWPYSSFVIDKMGRDIRYETPIPYLAIPSGDLEVEFVIPNMNNRKVIRRIRALPGQHVKLFEDFQNLDNLKQ